MNARAEKNPHGVIAGRIFYCSAITHASKIAPARKASTAKPRLKTEIFSFLYQRQRTMPHESNCNAGKSSHLVLSAMSKQNTDQMIHFSAKVKPRCLLFSGALMGCGWYCDMARRLPVEFAEMCALKQNGLLMRYRQADSFFTCAEGRNRTGTVICITEGF